VRSHHGPQLRRVYKQNSSCVSVEPDGTDAAEVLQIVTAQIYYRLFIAGEQPSQALADRAAATAAAAARANVPSHRRHL